jgi:hypothetical protein
MQFCTACGAPSAHGAAAVAPPAQPAAPTPPAEPAASAASAAPAASSGPSAVKIVLIVVVILIGLGILAVGAFGFMVWRVAHTINQAVHVSDSGKQATITIPGANGGTFSTNPSKTYSASELGTDIYPGAQAGHGGMTMNLPTGSMVTALYVTSDSKDKVLDFYKSRFGSAASVVDTADGAVLTLAKSQQESVMVTITAKPSADDGKTQIAIVHTKTNKPS